MARPTLPYAAMATAALLCATLIVTFYAGVLYEGRSVARADTAELQDLQRRYARATAWLRGERTSAENTLRDEILGLQTQLKESEGKADADHQAHLSGLRAGTVSVRVPIVTASCGAAGIQPAGNSGTAAATTLAELDPAAAADLAGIARDGDTGIRELNLCIGQYNAARDAMARWRETLQKAEHVQAQ